MPQPGFIILIPIPIPPMILVDSPDDLGCSERLGVGSGMLGDARGWMGDARNKRAVGGSQWKTRGRWMGEGAVERSRRTLNKRKANEKPREREREREKERERERE